MLHSIACGSWMLLLLFVIKLPRFACIRVTFMHKQCICSQGRFVCMGSCSWFGQTWLNGSSSKHRFNQPFVSVFQLKIGTLHIILNCHQLNDLFLLFTWKLLFLNSIYSLCSTTCTVRCVHDTNAVFNLMAVKLWSCHRQRLDTNNDSFAYRFPHSLHYRRIKMWLKCIQQNEFCITVYFKEKKMNHWSRNQVQNIGFEE